MDHQPLDQNFLSTNNRPLPKSWLVESILATLFCCLPLGIAGIVNAAKVESRYRSGDIAGAENASAAAKKWTMLALAIGLIGGIFYFLFKMYFTLQRSH